MRKFIIRRIAYLLLTYWAFITVLFVIFRMTPGDPTTMYVVEGMTEAERQATLERYGLTDPLHIQYLNYVGDLLRGDLGFSYRYNTSVASILIIKFWNTIFLMATSLLIAYSIGILFGAYLGWVRGTAKEKGGLLLALIFRSSPEFWIGIVLLSVFVFRLGWFPWGGIRAIGAEAPVGFTSRYFNREFAYHLFLPALTGAIYYMAQPILLMRSSMISVLNSDFIEIKKAEGLSPTRIVYKHAARNSMLPMATVIALVAGMSIGGSLVIETVFSWPGMGREMVESVHHNDYPMAMGAFFLMGTVVIFMNFLADIAYVYLDPRVRYD
ncbi:ABC transporter permease [Halobacteria archaeon AArc-curdl1]|uniref:ABC transporter permease n=1 Tax=Natronosalvus hydrolyticus TaxID=2979988 RepID=A0AAP2Z777_9EURY|nr:ABC transporter permease [Halobacteria archaeon AArc-curdl1]